MSSKPPRIVVLGSINMDLVLECAKLPQPGETVIGLTSREVPGGKGANQAVGAARLGADVAMIGRVGSDSFAERLVANLLKENVETSEIIRCADCASGVAMVAVEQGGENSIIVVPGANGNIDREDVLARTDVIRSANLLVMQLEIPVETILATLKLAKALGIKTLLNPAPMPKDPNPRLWEVDLLCPNQTEAAMMLQRKIETLDDARQAIPELLRKGAQHAIITMGSQGAVVGGDGEVHWIEPFPVQAVDTTAAGDAFVAAVAVKWSEGSSLREAAEFGCAAGALKATRWGAQPGMPRRSEVEELVRSRSPYGRDSSPS